MRRVRTERELADAVNRGDDEILIEGKLGGAILRIKGTGRAVWAAVIVALAATVALVWVWPPLIGAAAPVAVAALGLSAAVTAAKLLREAKSAQILSTLRDDYRVIEDEDGSVILRRK